MAAESSSQKAVGKILKEAGVTARAKRAGRKPGFSPNTHPKFKAKTPEQQAMEEALAPMTAKMVALFSAWVVNGRNISKAARATGMSPHYAYELFERHPAFREAKSLLPQILTQDDQEWIECLPDARRTLRSLLYASEEKVQYLAAREIVDRAEGKAVTKVDMTFRDESPSLSDAEMQLAFSIMQQFGKGFAETLQFMKANPQQVAEWVAQHGLPASLPSPVPQPVEADYEIVPEQVPSPVKLSAPLLAFTTGWCPELELSELPA